MELTKVCFVNMGGYKKESKVLKVNNGGETSEKKYLYLILLVFILSIAFYIRYYKQQEYDKKYYISLNESSIESHLKVWLIRDDGMKLDPKVFDIQQLGSSSTYMVLFELEKNTFGNAELVKGRNGKLRIKESSYGDFLMYDYEDIKTNKGRYYLVLGKNPDLVVDHLKVIVDHKKAYSYLVDVSKDKFFYHYKKIPDELDQRTKILYYDKNNMELSDDQLREIFLFKSNE
jgi:hypothetical protein